MEECLPHSCHRCYTSVIVVTGFHLVTKIRHPVDSPGMGRALPNLGGPPDMPSHRPWPSWGSPCCSLTWVPVSAVRARGRRGGPGEAPAGHPGQARKAAVAAGHQVGRVVGRNSGRRGPLIPPPQPSRGRSPHPRHFQNWTLAHPRLSLSQECGGPHGPGPLRQHGDARGAGGV